MEDDGAMHVHDMGGAGGGVKERGPGKAVGVEAHVRHCGNCSCWLVKFCNAAGSRLASAIRMCIGQEVTGLMQAKR